MASQTDNNTETVDISTETDFDDMEFVDITQLEPDSSDIDIIECQSSDDENNGSVESLCNCSVVSQKSNMSFLTDQYLLQTPDYINEDLSETSSLNFKELSTEVELKKGVRAYVHTRNAVLNGKLNLVLVLTLTAVIGLGIGNFIGWSNHWKQQKQLSLGQVMKLRQLQDELQVCIQNQCNAGSETSIGQTDRICYSNNDYWKEKFETLFSENGGLMELFEKTQKHFHDTGNHENIISDIDCDNKSANDEFHNLKLGFLVKQMEHLQLLKRLKEVQYKGQQSEKRVQDLEEENNELKIKLEEEEEDDEMIVKSWGNRVAVLENENKKLRSRIDDDEEEDLLILQDLNNKIDELLFENNELKAAIGQLEAQVVVVVNRKSAADDGYSLPTVSDSKNKIPIKLDLLRQRINQMLIENDELKTTIARLRWSSHSQESDVIIEEEEDDGYESSSLELSELEKQMNDLKNMLMSEQNESKKWKEMYEKLKLKNGKTYSNNNDNENKESNKNKFDENIVYEWIWNSTKVLKEVLVTGSSVVGDSLKTFYNKMSKNESIIPNEIFSGINATQKILFELNQRLVNKWHEMNNLRNHNSNGDEKISFKMGKLLKNTLRKLQEAGDKISHKHESMKSKVQGFYGKISKLVENLDNKWNDLLFKWSKRYGKQHNSDEGFNAEKYSKNNWYFDRGNSRREQQSVNEDIIKNTVKPKNTKRSEYVFSEDEDSGKEEEENWFLKREKRLRSNNEYDIDNESMKTKRMKRDDGNHENRYHYSSGHSRQR